MSTVKMAALELNTEVRDVMRAASITETRSPRSPTWFLEGRSATTRVFERQYGNVFSPGEDLLPAWYRPSLCNRILKRGSILIVWNLLNICIQIYLFTGFGRYLHTNPGWRKWPHPWRGPGKPFPERRRSRAEGVWDTRWGCSPSWRA